MSFKLPTKKQFLKISKATSIISNTLVVIFLSIGHSEDSLVLLICRVGISGFMSAIETLYENETTHKIK